MVDAALPRTSVRGGAAGDPISASLNGASSSSSQRGSAAVGVGERDHAASVASKRRS
jgi:hypothetical protein